jgi:heparin/heparan-sulfate lyase
MRVLTAMMLWLVLAAGAGGATPVPEGPTLPQGVWPRDRLGRTPSVEPGKWGKKWGTIEYGHKVEHCALSAEELGETIRKVVEGHPRLLVRSEPWEGGLTVAQLRARVKQEPWAKRFARLAREAKKDAARAIKSKKQLGYYEGRPIALYYLATGDDSVVPPLVDYVLAAKPMFNCGGGLVTTCQVYDWICTSPTLTDEQKKKMRDHIAATAFRCARVQQSGHAFAMFHHRGACGWMADTLAAGLVLHGEHPDAEKLLRWAVGYFVKNYFRGWRRLGGRWSDYYIGSRQMPMAIACWASAVEEPNVYDVIRREYGDWLQGHMYYLMAARLPSRTFSAPAAGFLHSQTKALSSSTNYLLICRGYKNPDGYAFLRWMHRGRRGALDPKYDVLLYDRETDEKEAWFKQDAPFAWMWGRDGNGYVQMRSKGWAPDSTVVDFRCGDYVWSHALTCNNNSFYIYHKGHLALHSGLYDDYYRDDHTAHYYPRTVASNSMLIEQPGEFWWSRRTFPAYGGQRLPYRGGSTNFTYDEYLSRLDAKHRFEMGEILAFEYGPEHRWAYVCGDATDAYNNPKYCDVSRDGKRKNKPKIDLFTRSMVYLPRKGHLIVFDRVNALDPDYRKAWLLHSVGRPEISGERIGAQVPGHIEDFDGDTVQVTWQGGIIPPPDPKDPGRLFVKTFLPEEHTIRRIGGKDHEFWVGGKNRPIKRYTGCIKPGTRHPVEVGNWRIEVSPNRPAKFDNFLHLIHICDTRTKQCPPAGQVVTKDGGMVGLHVGGWLVMFGRKGEVAGLVAYRAPEGETEHLVVDLKRRARYVLAGPNKEPKEVTASEEGAVRFATTEATDVTLTPAE